MKRVKFVDFELHFDTFSLNRGSETIAIGQRSLDLLIHLIENRDRFVSLEDLQEHVWHGEKLSPSAIATCVREVRKLLSDDARNPRIIASKRGRGYRFVAHPEFTHRSPLGLDALGIELPFVGRAVELQLLNRAHRAIVSRKEGQLIVLRGEAGIGKTRLVDEFLRSTPHSSRKFISRCRPGGASASFSLWSGMREGTDSIVYDGKSRHMDGSNYSVLQLKMTADTEAKSASPFNRGAIFTKWAAAVRNLVGSNSSIFVFDDIHLADPDSLHLVAWIAEILRDLPILLIATQRPKEASRATGIGIEDIIAVEHCLVVDIEPVSADKIKELVRSHPLNELVDSDQLFSTTGGNPLLVSHALKTANDGSVDADTSFQAGRALSRSLDIVTRFTCDLSEETREILSIAAIEGEIFEPSLISRVARVPLIDVEVGLESAVRARLVSVNSMHFRFRHPILRDALLCTLDSSKRKLLHAAIASDLQDRAISPCAIATHMALAMPHSDCSEAARYCTLAFEESIFTLDYIGAKWFAEKAVELTLLDASAATEQRCRLMINLAKSHGLIGERQSARSILIEVAEIARACQLRSLLSDCALVLSDDFSSIDVGVHDVALEALIREAVDATPRVETGRKARLLARLSLSMRWCDKYAQQSSLAQEALALATESQDLPAIREALSAITESLHGPENAPKRLEVIESIGSLFPACLDSGSALLHHTRTITALLELGLVDQVSSVNKAYRELAQRTGQAHHIWYALTTDAMRKLMVGNMSIPDQIEGLFNSICAIGDNPNVVQGYAVQRFFREVECGNGEFVVPFLEDIVGRYPLVSSWRTALAWLHWDLGDHQQSLRHAAPFVPQKIDAMRREVGSGAGLAMISEVLAHVGSRTARRHLFEIVEPLKDRCATAGYGVLYLGTFARPAGLLARSLGLRSRAIELLELAVEQESLRGADLWRGYSLIDLSLALNAVREKKDDAREMWDEADRTARALRVPRLSRRVRDARSVVFE